VALAAAAAIVFGTGAVLEATRVDVRPLARRAPSRTALMRQRAAEAQRAGHRFAVDQRGVPYARISPLLRRAVLIAEDDAFYQHGGLDWQEVQASARRNLEARSIVRGGSTITQQLARNLYLGNARTPTRKLSELVLALRMERTLTKRRIFELYLNLIEWGDGIYGAEAAARRHFGVPASDLSARQAVVLAAVIINPRRFSAVTPPRRIERRVRMIASRMRRRGYLTEAQYAEVIGRPPPVTADSAGLAGPDSASVLPAPDSAGPVESPGETTAVEVAPGQP
jgi:monofunctional biosynthetic peptidoglycan transglycosylase